MAKLAGNRLGVAGVYCYTGKKEEDTEKAECTSGACHTSIAIGQVFKTRMPKIYVIIHLFFSDGVTKPQWLRHEGRGCLFPFLNRICEDIDLPNRVEVCEQAGTIKLEVGHDI